MNNKQFSDLLGLLYFGSDSCDPLFESGNELSPDIFCSFLALRFQILSCLLRGKDPSFSVFDKSLISFLKKEEAFLRLLISHVEKNFGCSHEEK